MKKTIPIILILAQFVNCTLFPTEPKLMKEANTSVVTIEEDTLTTLEDLIPVEDNLILNIELDKYHPDEPINYTAKLQNSSSDTIKLDNSMEQINGKYVINGFHKKCMTYRIMSGTHEFTKETNEADMIIWLRKHGYIETTTKNDTLTTRLCNSKVYYWKKTYNIPYPLVFSKQEEMKDKIRLDEGKYYFQVDIDYSINENNYQAVFISDEFTVGTGTGIVEDRLYKQSKLLRTRRIK